jgi:hypothetical protein
MKVNIEDIKIYQAFRRAINTVPLEDIDMYENGKKVEIPIEWIKEWTFTGLNNIDFFTEDDYKTGPQEYTPETRPTLDKSTKVTIVEDFADKLFNKIKDLDPEIAKVVNDNFWELIDTKDKK